MSRLSEVKPDEKPNGVAAPGPSPAPVATEPPVPVMGVSVFPDLLDDDQQQLLSMITAIAPELESEPLLMIQNGECPYGRMCECSYAGIRGDFKRNVPRGKKCTVILHSGGGYAGPAYRLARFLKRHCGGYNVIIPSRAKSAATLFALGADRIFLGEDAELGPLDAQITDLERETNISALEVVQSVEQLSEEALNAVDAAIVLWQNRCGKKVESLLPTATKFIADLMHPLFTKIDAVHFTGMARILQVAQDYATRLLVPRYGVSTASRIALGLTSTYSDHDFAIDAGEATSLGLKIERIPSKIREKVEAVSLWLDEEDDTTLTGRIVTHAEDTEGNDKDEASCAPTGECRTSSPRSARGSVEQLGETCRQRTAR